MSGTERLVWLGGAILAVVLVAVLASSCGAAEKLLTVPNANLMRASTRQVCADLAEADRLAGVLLDDAGVRPEGP